jgi:murein DD-endopeptidase MepM/ murein hydrolase activator NlpD
MAPLPVQTAPPKPPAWQHPLPGYCLRGYGMRTHPITGVWKMHNGADSRGAPYGTPIRAAHAGTARHGWEAGGAGTYVTVQGDAVATAYFHMSSRAVGNGVWVNAGQVIGYVGSTGLSTGPHLHFEVHPWGLWNGRTDPVGWMAQRGVQIGCA